MAAQQLAAAGADGSCHALRWQRSSFSALAMEESACTTVPRCRDRLSGHRTHWGGLVGRASSLLGARVARRMSYVEVVVASRRRDRYCLLGQFSCEADIAHARTGCDQHHPFLAALERSRSAAFGHLHFEEAAYIHSSLMRGDLTSNFGAAGRRERLSLLRSRFISNLEAALGEQHELAAPAR